MIEEEKIIKVLSMYDPPKAILAQLQLMRKKYQEATDSFIEEVKKIREEKRWGEMGPKPEAGIDYQLPQDGHTPVKGVDYFDGETFDPEPLKAEILALIPPKVSAKTVARQVLALLPSSPEKETLVNEILALIPPPVNGKDAVLDEDKIISSLIERLKTNKELDISHIRNSNQFMFGKKKYKIEELMHGGGSSGGGFTTIPATETPNGSLTVFTFPTATAQPTFIVSDNAMTQPTTGSGAVNWVWDQGTKTATLTIPPIEDIVAIA